MKLFGFGKKAKEEETCGCGTACDTQEETEACDCGGACDTQEETEACDCGGACDTQEEAEACGCGTACDTQEDSAKSDVKVLGSGCAKCNQLEKATKEALSELNMDTTVEHVTDFQEIAKYGVMATPALVIDGKVVSYGKVLKTKEVVSLLKQVRG